MQIYQKNLLFFIVFLCCVIGHGFGIAVWGALNDPHLEAVSVQPKRVTEKGPLLKSSQEDKDDACCLTRFLSFCGLLSQESPVVKPKVKKRQKKARSSACLKDRSAVSAMAVKVSSSAMSAPSGQYSFDQRRNPESDF